jgi:hypothetical protein
MRGAFLRVDRPVVQNVPVMRVRIGQVVGVVLLRPYPGEFALGAIAVDQPFDECGCGFIKHAAHGSHRMSMTVPRGDAAILEATGVFP